MPYTQCDQEDIHSWHWTHHPHVLEDDPIFHWHLRFRANPGLPHGLPVESCVVHDGRRTFGGNLVPNLPHYSDYNGSFSSPPSLCWQQTVPGRSFVGLWNLLCQFPAPGVLRPSDYFGNGTGPGVPGLLHRVRAFRTPLQPPARLQPGHGPILRITSSGTTIWFRLTTIFGRQMCAPCTRTDSRFRRIASFVQSSRFLQIRFNCRCQAYSPISTHLLTVVKFVAAPTPLCLRLTSHFLLDVSLLPSKLYFTDCCTDFSAGSPSNSFPFTLLALFDVSRWLLHLLQRLFRFKNQFFFNFFMMFTMLIFYYIEQWPYFHLLSSPTLNPHLFPALTYGTNLTGSDRTTRTRPMPLLTQSTSRHPTSLRKRPLWMSCWKPISLNHISMLLPRHLKPFLNHLSSLLHHHLRNANRRPKQFPKYLRSVVAFMNIRDPAPRAHFRHGPSKKNKNFVHWKLMRNPDFHGGWSRPRWPNLKMTFDLCGTRSKTHLADHLWREIRKRTSCGNVLPLSIPNFVCLSCSCGKGIA